MGLVARACIPRRLRQKYLKFKASLGIIVRDPVSKTNKWMNECKSDPLPPLINRLPAINDFPLSHTMTTESYKIWPLYSWTYQTKSSHNIFVFVAASAQDTPLEENMSSACPTSRNSAFMSLQRGLPWPPNLNYLLPLCYYITTSIFHSNYHNL